MRQRGFVSASGKDDPVLGLIDDLVAQTERCRRVTESMLGFTREVRSHLVPAELDGILGEAISNVSAARDLSRIELFAERTNGDVPPVQCDATQLQLVLTNVLVNAVDSVREAAREKGRVRVTIRCESGMVLVVVRDNGTGIPREIQHRVFDPFFTSKPAGEGTGLGLPVALGLVQAGGLDRAHEHGGRWHGGHRPSANGAGGAPPRAAPGPRRWTSW